ncbi:DUF4157 domain-containing protein [Aerosakkonemataceae cyanobacterium BLCC-F50]|uniref:DUF4157 domain-containing protein n=1 Tax=Floridaenema flaviceps BLCC-F50 TaxID=3153642 RepID=A0ABV4XJ71_9CYAN
MSERISAKTKNSSTVSPAAQTSVPLLQRHSFTNTKNGGTNSTLLSEQETPQPSFARAKFDLSNVSLFAPAAKANPAMVSAGTVQRQEEKKEKPEDVQMKPEAQVLQREETAESEAKKPGENEAKISPDEEAQQQKVARASFDLANVSVFPKAIQRQEAEGEKKEDDKAEVQAKSEAGTTPQSEEEKKKPEDVQMKEASGEVSPQEEEKKKLEEVQKKEAEGKVSPEEEQKKKPEEVQKEAAKGKASPQEEEEKKKLAELKQKEAEGKLSSEEQEEKKRLELLMKSVQTKLAVGKPGDKYEQEADSAAAKVMTMPEKSIQRQAKGEEEEVQAKSLANSSMLQRQAEGEEEEVQAKPLINTISPMVQRQAEGEEEEVQAKSLGNSSMLQREAEGDEEVQMKASGVRQSGKDGGLQAASGVETSLANSKGGGSPLPDEVKGFMEPRFGADFSGVRVHTDSTAVQMNKELGAQAFAHGSDIYYGAGKSPGKDELTAHELTHTIQQTGGVQAKKFSNSTTKENKIQAKENLAETKPQQEKVSPAKSSKGQQADSVNKENSASPDEKAAKEGQPPVNPEGKANQASADGKAAKEGQPPVNPEGKANSASADGKGGKEGQGSAIPVVKGAAPDGKGAKGGQPEALLNTLTAGGKAGAAVGGAGNGAGAGGAGEGGEAPRSPEKDPAYQGVIDRAKGVATQQKDHPPAEKKSNEAQAAALPPGNEVETKAQDRQVQEMEKQPPGSFNAEAFKEALMQKISQATPGTLEEADNFKNNNKLDSVKGELSSQVGDEKKQAVDPVEQKTKEEPKTEGIKGKSVTPLPPKQAGAPPPNVGAEQAAPKPKTESEVSLQAGSQSIDKQMADGNITEEQLAKSNEPQFQSALEAKGTAQTHANTAPQAYRQEEKGILTQAQMQAQTTAKTDLQEMHSGKQQAVNKVAGLQGDTKGHDEQKRSEVANNIQKIYNNTKQNVENLLGQLDSEVNQQFDEGASKAKAEFEDYVGKRMERYKNDRYSGILGPGRWLWDKLFGMPGEVNAFYQEGKDKFIASMGQTIDNIANHVAEKLNAAKNEIAKGRKEINKYVSGLDPSLKKVGQEAAEDIKDRFDELEETVNNKQDELVDSLAQKYNENLQQVDARIEQMKEENKGLVQKAVEFIVNVAKTVVELTKMLAQVLMRAISVLDKIIFDPIGFFSNLVNGVKQGFQNFMQNIGQHLAKGLIGWLSGKVASAGLQMPESLDAKGIFTLVAQIMGLTFENVRERAAKRLGEEKVSQMESTFEMFIVLKNQGIAGLWQFIQDTVGDLNERVMEPIKNYVIESVIKAGINWVFSLLSPASAFVKACQMIYEVVKFFVERASEIVDLVNAVLDSIVAIANGAIGEAAKKIEDALAKALPLVIDLLARVIGLGGVSQKVQGMITKVRGPIDRAIDKVIDKGAKVANKVGDKFESGKGKGKKNKDKNNKREDKTQGKDNSGERKNRADEKAQTRGHNDKADEKDQTRDKNNRKKDSKNNTKNPDKAKDNNDKKGKDSKNDKRTQQQKQADLGKALTQADQLVKDDKISSEQVKERLPGIKSKYKMTSLKLIVDSKDDVKEIVHVEGIINPKDKKPKSVKFNYSEALTKAKSEFGERLFARKELETYLSVNRATALKAINKWKEEGQLHTLASASSDPLTQYSFDKNKAGQRDTNPNNRSKYGYSNPAKDSAVGLQILSKGLRSDSPEPILKDDANYHKNKAQYDSTRPGSTYKNFVYSFAILGHKDPGASGHWNRIGHKQSKAENQAWNKEPNSYQGPEHKEESSASGGSAERYRVPSKAIGSHSDWW